MENAFQAEVGVPVFGLLEGSVEVNVLTERSIRLTPEQLVPRWRGLAGLMRNAGCFPQVVLYTSCAADLERALRDWEEEPLTLAQAQDYSGFSYSALQQKVAAGELENMGEKGTPRVRRGDLPRKSRPPRDKCDLADVVLEANFN